MQVVQAAYDLAPVIADVISAHCRGTSARQIFIRACFLGDWEEARSMVEGMLAEPWVLRGHQEARLCEFLELLLPVTAMGTPRTATVGPGLAALPKATSALSASRASQA
jgi:hypothetical protein